MTVGLMSHVSNASMQEVEAKWSGLQEQYALHSKTA